jgi:transcriptional regulator with XRE-family HTH domain
MPTCLFNGSALRNARRRHGLTQAELARLVGHSTSTIGRLERHGGNPRADTVTRLAEGLQVSVQEFVVFIKPWNRRTAETDERLEIIDGWVCYMISLRAARLAGWQAPRYYTHPGPPGPYRRGPCRRAER